MQSAKSKGSARSWLEFSELHNIDWLIFPAMVETVNIKHGAGPDYLSFRMKHEPGGRHYQFSVAVDPDGWLYYYSDWGFQMLLQQRCLHWPA